MPKMKSGINRYLIVATLWMPPDSYEENINWYD